MHLSTVGRGELVQWINAELDLNLKDISEVGFCGHRPGLMDARHSIVI